MSKPKQKISTFQKKSQIKRNKKMQLKYGNRGKATMQKNATPQFRGGYRK